MQHSDTWHTTPAHDESVAASTYPSPHACAFVVVHRARGLAAADANGLSDPFCSCRLADEKHKTDKALLPLKLQQTEVDEKVKEELAKIASLKAVIHKNDERIQELMNMTIGAR